jgi:nucleotide-binding universal stress UspA family protein
VLVALEGSETSRKHDVEVADVHVRFGPSIDETLQQTQEELDAGLLVVGAHRSGAVASRLITGAGGSGVVRRSTASNLVVRPAV